MTEHPAVGVLTDNVVALGKEVESLRRMTEHQRTRLDELGDGQAGIDEKITALAGTVAELGDALAELVAEEDEEDKRLSWFDQDDQAQAAELLDELAGWLERVYLRYGSSTVPACWMWHPDTVEELLWLWRAWTAAYRSRGASAFRQADWHDRYRTGVVERLKKVGTCSIREHVAPDGKLYAAQPRRLGMADSRVAVTTWWTGGRGTPPSPTPDDIREAEIR